MNAYISPLFPALCLFVIFAFLRHWRRSERGHKPVLLGVSVVLVLLVSYPQVAKLSLRPLEGRYSRTAPDPDGAKAIVVLASGASYPTIPTIPFGKLAPDTSERVDYAAWFFKNRARLPILVTGRIDAPGTSRPVYEFGMTDELKMRGVPPEMIWQEDRSESTHENAVESAKVLKSKGIDRVLLITDAYHMLRAELAFEKQGIQVIPAACEFRTFYRKNADTLLFSWEAIGIHEEVLHEYLGLAVYKMRGWI